VQYGLKISLTMMRNTILNTQDINTVEKLNHLNSKKYKKGMKVK
jgi:hypothetical protein